ncbi:MAG: enantioselective carboxylesterase CesB [Anaerolineales bacterium]
MSTQPPTTMFRTPEGEARYFDAYAKTMALWPVEVQSFDIPTSFGSTHIHSCGPEDAAPLLLIHGQAISSTMWYPNVGGLSHHFRVYAPDILGDMGKSIQTRPFKQPADFGDWMRELLDELKIERAHVAGLSYGGFIAAQTALSLPERVNSLILMAPASLLSIRPIFFLRMMGVLIPGLSFVSKQKLIMGTAPTNAIPAIQQMFTTNDFRYSMYLPPTFKDDQLRQIRAPTLLLIGEQEVIYNYKAAIARAKKLIPNIETTIIPGAGHALNFDQPEIVNQHILAFLNK